MIKHKMNLTASQEAILNGSKGDVTSVQKFTADPRPLDKNVPSSFIQNIVFNTISEDSPTSIGGGMNRQN